MKLTANGPVHMSTANSGRLVSLPEANCIVSETKNRLVSNGLKAPRLAGRSKQTGFLFKALFLKTLEEWRVLILQKGQAMNTARFLVNSLNRPQIKVMHEYSISK